ncbi:MAG: HAMP domain-containing protein [Sphingobium sp.]|nr:HAMP domain-containing protein [Sphingobium sp.]
MMFPRRSILTQTFVLLVGALIVLQGVGIASLFLLPPQRQEGVALMQIVDRFQNERPRMRRRMAELQVVHQARPPVPEEGLVADTRLTADFAQRMGVSPENVRLYYRPDRSGSNRRNGAGKDDGIVRWRGEPFFYNRTIIAVDSGNGTWRVIHTPDRPLIAEWQKRMAIVFVLALLSMLPLAWLFARRLVKPIHAFAEAADRVGRDAAAPMVREDGPAELRVAARAVNAMQGRIAEQMREREAMVAAIAHDLRTPLSRIAFRIEAADEALREPIQRDIEQMKAMITTTLSFVRGSSPDAPQEPVDITGLIEEIVANEQHVDRPVSWQGERPSKDLTVRGDRIALGRMIQNLVDNAIAYGSQANIGLENGGDEARITIADRGPGLPAEEVEAMFAPFTRKERSRNRETGGVGLGLAIARAIARDHGGEIALGPRVGGGMEAVVTLPLATG